MAHPMAYSLVVQWADLKADLTVAQKVGRKVAQRADTTAAQ